MVKKIHISDVVEMIGASSAKCINNWILRNRIDIDSNKQKDKWREFSLKETQLLAIVRFFVDYNIPVDVAFENAQIIVAHDRTGKRAVFRRMTDRRRGWTLLFAEDWSQIHDAAIVLNVGRILDCVRDRYMEAVNDG